MAHRTDLDLVRRAIAHEPEALKGFARRAACIPGFLRSRASRLGLQLPSATLDDLTQDTYLAVWKKLASYRCEARLETWACGFAFIQLRRWQTSRYRDRRVPAELGDEPAIEAEPPNDLVEFVEAVLDTLGSPVEDVMRLKHFEGMTFDHIAERLQMSANTAKSHYYRGLARLRDRLGDRAEELAG